MHRRPHALAWLPLALLLAASSGFAEEERVPEPAPSFPDEAPPRMEEGPGAYQGDVERPDLIEYVRTLRRALQEYEKPAPRTEKVTALHDAWSRILKPRAPRMRRRLEKWEDRRRWLVPEGEQKPVGIAPDQWTTFTRDMASLATELHGAWTQYGTVKLREKKVGFGQATLPKPPRVTRFGYGAPVYRGGIRHRQVAGWGMGRYDMNSYWHLLNRFNAGWMYRQQRRADYDAHWRKVAQVRKRAFKDLRSELENTRESLLENLLGVQVLVAAMQNSEEERLAREFQAYPDDDTLREMVELGLKDMEGRRLDAERFEGKSSAAYGTLLRKWLRIQKAGVQLSVYVKSELEKAGEGEDEETPVQDER